MVQTFPFQSVFYGVLELLVQGVVWHPLHLFCMDENLACLLHSSGSAPAVFSISAWEWFSWHQGLSSNRCFELCPFYWCTSWLLSPRHWPHMPEMVRLFPCRWFSESWSWHPSVFQTIFSDSKIFLCLLSPCRLCVASMRGGCQALP